MGRYCSCVGKCHCNKPKEIVYPTRENVKKTYSDETVRHIHPSHTRVINNHTVRNEHLYPHSTSYEERVNEVDVRGARDFGPGRVAGVQSPYDGYGRGGGCGCGCGGRGRCGRRRGGFWC